MSICYKPAISRIQVNKCIRANPIKAHRNIPSNAKLIMYLVISLGEFLAVIFCVIVSQCKSYLKQAPQVINIFCFSIILKSIKRSFQIIKNRNSIKIARHSCSNSKLRRNSVKNSDSISIRDSLIESSKDSKGVNINNLIATFKFRYAKPCICIH